MTRLILQVHLCRCFESHCRAFIPADNGQCATVAILSYLRHAHSWVPSSLRKRAKRGSGLTFHLSSFTSHLSPFNHLPDVRREAAAEPAEEHGDSAAAGRHSHAHAQVGECDVDCACADCRMCEGGPEEPAYTRAVLGYIFAHSHDHAHCTSRGDEEAAI